MAKDIKAMMKKRHKLYHSSIDWCACESAKNTAIKMLDAI